MSDDLRVQRVDHRSGARSYVVLDVAAGRVHVRADRFLAGHGEGTQRNYAHHLVDHLRWLRMCGHDEERITVEDIAVRAGNTRLVIEQDDSIVRADRNDLFRLARQAGIADRLEYRHQRAYDEVLLALPDIVMGPPEPDFRHGHGTTSCQSWDHPGVS